MRCNSASNAGVTRSGSAMRHAMHHAVPHRRDGGEARLRLQPLQKKTGRRGVIGGLDGTAGRGLPDGVMDREIRAAQADAIHLSRQPRRRPSAWKSANLMLEEPPLIVRMQADFGFPD